MSGHENKTTPTKPLPKTILVGITLKVMVTSRMMVIREILDDDPPEDDDGPGDHPN